MYQNKNKSQVLFDIFDGKYPSTHLNKQFNIFKMLKEN